MEIVENALNVSEISLVFVENDVDSNSHKQYQITEISAGVDSSCFPAAVGALLLGALRP